ncbi:uncharacterized protein LOC110823495 isoform X2 [Carica papaya]|uniref:uncharacterized protein LOC110823495 isoform X2 n=1 Tax=Carica papaya TaxID=3649 RepID=UPI000B8CF301|nr:uncharacterized protein LOC110823495 isoform X2 [Carica papaya]
MEMAKTTPQLDICSGTRIDAASRFLKRIGPIPSLRAWARFGSPEAKHGKVGNRVAVIRNSRRKICTADELHYVSVHNSDWRLALWRYLPSSKAPVRNHPLLLLSGVATNAIGYDLSPESSFARFMSNQGFDTWIVELRGAGLSAQGVEFGETELPTNILSKQTDSTIIKGDQQSVMPPLSEWQEFLAAALEDFQKQLDGIVKYDWDFDHYLLEDVPATMEYIRTQSKPKDGKLHAIGHSMGGILLYAMLSKCCRDSGLASVTTLASTLDYSSSRSSLKFLIPLAEPAQALNVPIIPVGGLIAAAHPFASYPPYILSWLTPQISAPDMMPPELFEKLVLYNFCTVPAKLLLQLTTAFQEGGLCDRSGTFFYKDHIGKSNVPILALAGDKDLICPPEAVYETVKLIPERLVTYKVLGEPGGPHYGHYDLVAGRLAVNEVYPRIVEFLNCHDQI